MTNKEIAKHMKLLAQLLELHKENPFKVRAIDKAASVISKYPSPLVEIPLNKLEKIPGIGKSTAAKIVELSETGTTQETEDLLKETPSGVVSIMQIKGIGPKKAGLFWSELQIENLGALWYACKEDKISKLKGFGAKTQREIYQLVEFTIANEGKFRYADALPVVKEFNQQILTKLPESPYSITGALRRKLPVLDYIEFILCLPIDGIEKFLEGLQEISEIHLHEDYVSALFKNTYKVKIHSSTKENYVSRLLETTGNAEHIEQLKAKLLGLIPAAESEESLYKLAGVQYIPPVRREATNEFLKAESKQPLPLLSLEDLQGSLHNHSTWSDGINTLEEMALYCKDVLKLAYFGISDHSKTAVYANGLKEEEVHLQWEEIDQLNNKLAPFRIFKGIESDILANGALDYSNDTLAGFDFVVASIHSQLNMEKSKATARLIKAIENPYTTILGHPTARQLLIRKGYEIDHKKVIDACAANGVIIEINANPLRLDIDWSWIPYCLEKGVLLSVNPDAHSTAQLHYTEYGVIMGQKGGLTKENCLNAFDLKSISEYFHNRKSNINF